MIDRVPIPPPGYEINLGGPFGQESVIRARFTPPKHKNCRESGSGSIQKSLGEVNVQKTTFEIKCETCTQTVQSVAVESWTSVDGPLSKRNIIMMYILHTFPWFPPKISGR